MKCISLWQPWASLVVFGAKEYETRSWYTSYRGPLLIHAAKRLVKEELRHYGTLFEADLDCFRRKEVSVPGMFEPVELERLTLNCLIKNMPFGAIIGQVNLVDVQSTDWLHANQKINDKEFNRGNYAYGRFGWKLENPIRFDVAVPYKGSQGFFEVDLEELTRGAFGQAMMERIKP